MNNITRELLIQKVKETASKLDDSSLSCMDFVRDSGILKYKIYELFPERGWTEVAELAGLSVGGSGYKLSDDELLEEFHKVASTVGKIPTWNIFKKHARISPDTIRKRFGGAQGTHKRYKTWLENHFPESPILKKINIKSKHEIPLLVEEGLDIVKSSQSGLKKEWCKNDGTVYGPLISFRGMTHAPINEQGVVYLFGVVSYELGFIVESVQSAFPDCEAKRCIDVNEDRWQRVLIEFEYKSSNFHRHCHDSQKCDLIVCWEHDWSDCPLDVVELRTIIDKLDG